MSDAIITKESGRTVVRPSEDVVATSVVNLRTKLRSALNEGSRDLVVDLSEVRMIDSSGIGLLIASHNSLRKLGGKLSVIHASHDILSLLHTMRIHQHFSVSGEFERWTDDLTT